MLCRQIWSYAAATGRAQRDVSFELKGCAVSLPGKTLSHYRGWKRAGTLPQARACYRGDQVLRAAMRPTPLLLLRPQHDGLKAISRLECSKVEGVQRLSMGSNLRVEEWSLNCSRCTAKVDQNEKCNGLGGCARFGFRLACISHLGVYLVPCCPGRLNESPVVVAKCYKTPQRGRQRASRPARRRFVLQ
jgi:hypothetical protein